MSSIQSMSDIGRVLASKDGEFALKKFNDIIQAEVGQVERRMRSGLDKKEYQACEEQLKSLQSAKLILKSIHLYHSA